jgi:hypothetical protein
MSILITVFLIVRIYKIPYNKSMSQLFATAASSRINAHFASCHGVYFKPAEENMGLISLALLFTHIDELATQFF